MFCGVLRKWWLKWGQRFQLVMFLFLGLIFAALHHLLGIYISRKPVSHVIHYGRWAVPSQSAVSALSIVLSQSVKWLLASTIGVAFAQYFWSATTSTSYNDWRKLDAPLAAASGNPFTISALPTWYRSPGLAFSAFTMLAMIGIPIVVPGSIRVVTSSGIMQPCTVDSPNITMANLATALLTLYRSTVPDAELEPVVSTYRATPKTTSLVNRIMVGDSYLQVPNPCHGACAYKVNFTAPSLKCWSNNNYNFSTNFPVRYRDGMLILNGILSLSESGYYELTVATRAGFRLFSDGDTDTPVAVTCNAYRADYHVRVQHDNFSSYIDILDITFGSILSPPDESQPLEHALGGLFLAVADAFDGSLFLSNVHETLAETNVTAGYSPMLHWNPGTNNSKSNFTWSDLTTSLPELMQNVSVSLLSGQFPTLEATYMTKVQTECSMTQLVYEYDSRRLLFIYAVAWAAATLFLSSGFYFVRKNKGEHNLDFSHVVEEHLPRPYFSKGLHDQVPQAATFCTTPSSETPSTQIPAYSFKPTMCTISTMVQSSHAQKTTKDEPGDHSTDYLVG